MTNLEIDRKLAETLGLHDVSEYDSMILIQRFDPDGLILFAEWHPTENMSDAWEVAEHFGFRYLRKNTLTGKYQAYLQFANEKSDTAPMAICLAALQLIEGSKSDGKRL